MRQRGISSRLKRAFWIQVLMISVATMFGVFGSAAIVEQALVRSALEGESTHFWALYEQDNQTPPPNTLNLRGYIAPLAGLQQSNIPTDLKPLDTGFQRSAVDTSEQIIHVSDNDQYRLYLVFDEEQVTKLSLFFGVVPLALVLLVIYLLSWITYRASQRAISPVISLARMVENIDLAGQDLAKLDFTNIHAQSDQEVATLVVALEHFTKSLSAAINRERSFTRDASHELRTPLAVIKGCMNIIERRANDDKYINDSSARITRTVNQMESLIKTLLMLARDEITEEQAVKVDVNAICDNVHQTLQPEAQQKNLQLACHYNDALYVNSTEDLVSILVTNLVQNAIRYTDEGKITLTITDTQLRVSDTGVGIDESDQQKIFQTFFRGAENTAPGHGLGLAIVQRICEKNGWKISLTSHLGSGSTFIVDFE